jgi:hypothetical protein
MREPREESGGMRYKEPGADTELYENMLDNESAIDTLP